MQKLIEAAICSSLLAIAGCSIPTAKPMAPASAPPQWYAPLPHGGSTQALAQWWSHAGDPVLVQLIEASQSVSPGVAQAAARIAQARLARTSSQAASGPRLDATVSANRNKNDPTLPVATVVQAGLQARWEIDLFGALDATRLAAQARLDGAQAGWHEARVAVAAETAIQYYNLRTCERQRAIATADATSRAQTAQLTQQSATAGFAAPASAALARASAAESAMRVTRQQGLCDLDVKALVALSGWTEPQLRQQLAGGTAVLGMPRAFGVQSVPAQLLAQRPDVFNAERDVAAASAEMGSAQAQRYPRLTLNGSIAAGNYYSAGNSREVSTWSIGPLALTLPLLDGGQIAANIEAAAARYDEASSLYRARVRLAVREVEEALVNLQSAQARNENASIATDGYRASLMATEARYRGGLSSLVELEDARRNALAAESALVDLQRERVVAWVTLYRAVGGGWTAPPASAAQGSGRP